MNSISPKTRFLSLPGDTPLTKPAMKWSDSASSTAVQDVLQVALAEFALRLAASGPVEASQCYYRLEGARDFIKILLNLGERDAPTASPASKPLHET